MEDKIKIMYVDDELINLQLFDINFSEMYDVFIVDNPLDALKILDKEMDISIVISDMKMPHINGIEFIKQAKEKFPDKKYCVLTGYEITDEIQEALNTGLIMKYFIKPYDLSIIDQILDL